MKTSWYRVSLTIADNPDLDIDIPIEATSDFDAARAAVLRAEDVFGAGRAFIVQDCVELLDRPVENNTVTLMVRINPPDTGEKEENDG